MKKLTSIVLALTLSVFASASAMAITVSNVHSNITGTVKTNGTSTAQRYSNYYGVKEIELASGLGESRETYTHNETATVNGVSKSGGTFSGGSRYQVAGNTVVGNSWETQSLEGNSKQTVEGSFNDYRYGVEMTRSANGEVNDTRNFSSSEFGSYENFTRTNFSETTRTRSHFAQ